MAQSVLLEREPYAKNDQEKTIAVLPEGVLRLSPTPVTERVVEERGHLILLDFDYPAKRPEIAQAAPQPRWSGRRFWARWYDLAVALLILACGSAALACLMTLK